MIALNQDKYINPIFYEKFILKDLADMLLLRLVLIRPQPGKSYEPISPAWGTVFLNYKISHYALFFDIYLKKDDHKRFQEHMENLKEKFEKHFNIADEIGLTKILPKNQSQEETNQIVSTLIIYQDDPVSAESFENLTNQWNAYFPNQTQQQQQQQCQSTQIQSLCASPPANPSEFDIYFPQQNTSHYADIPCTSVQAEARDQLNKINPKSLSISKDKSKLNNDKIKKAIQHDQQQAPNNQSTVKKNSHLASDQKATKK